METNGKTTESHGGHRGERSQPPEQEPKCMEQVQTLGKERETRAGVKTQHQLKAKTQSALSTTEIRLRGFKARCQRGRVLFSRMKERGKEGNPSTLDPAPGWWSCGTVLSNPVCTSQQILRGKLWRLHSWGHLEFGVTGLMVIKYLPFISDCSFPKN